MREDRSAGIIGPERHALRKTPTVHSRRCHFPLLIRISPSAFTLVEMVLAIGIACFAIIAVLGLFSVGAQSSRSSNDDTNLALMTRQAVAWIRTQSFTSMSASTGTLLYFDSMGQLVRNTAGDPATAPGASAIYSCTISPKASGVSLNLIYLQIRFQWPLSAPSPSRQQRVVISSLANEN